MRFSIRLKETHVCIVADIMHVLLSPVSDSPALASVPQCGQARVASPVRWFWMPGGHETISEDRARA